MIHWMCNLNIGDKRPDFLLTFGPIIGSKMKTLKQAAFNLGQSIHT